MAEHWVARVQRWWEVAVRAVPLLGWISYLPLLLTLLGVLLVVAGLGTGLGIPSLIWHDHAPTQLLAGLAVTGLCLHLGMTGYLLDTRERPFSQHGEATVGEIARYVIWPSLALLLVAGFGVIRQQPLRWNGVWALVGPVGAFVALTFLCRSALPISRLLPPGLRERATSSVRRHGSRARWTESADIDHGAHAVQAVAMLALAVLYGLACLFPWSVPAMVAVTLALALVTGVWGLFAFWLRRYRLVGVGILLLVLFASGVTRDVAPAGVTQAALFCKPPGTDRLLDLEALEAWKKRVGEHQPLVVVVTSGGASRSALWTVDVLDALTRRIPGFMSHVRVVTGASGGMVGAAHYVSAIDADRPAPPIEDVRAGVVADSLTGVARALILPGVERGRALELAWESSTEHRLAQLSRPFVALTAGERAGWRPSLVFAPMMVEDGRRLIISNLDLTALTTSLAPASECLGATPCQSRSAVELFACPGEGLDRLRISTVARMNATFPWVTSAALLPSQPPRRVVDAGYYDNFGVDIASLWIRTNASWLRENTSGVLLVQIRDGQSADDRQRVGLERGPGYMHEWVSALTTPPEGMLAARNASMAFRNDDEVGLLATHPMLSRSDRFFETTLFELPGQAPLNWYLSDAAIASIDQPPDERMIRTLDDLAAWWRERSSPVEAATR
jgi:hypothetical protein